MHVHASAVSILEKLKIHASLGTLLRQYATLVSQAGSQYAFKRAHIGGQMLALLVRLGVDTRAKAREVEAFKAEAAEPLEQPRQVRGELYEFDPNRTHGQRKKDNAAAMELLRQIDAGEVPVDSLTDDHRRTLAKYSGTGGNLVGADGKRGSAYEYFTPKPAADGVWSLLAELGFKGGKVLDPCAGVGIFGATAPANAAVESVELNETAGRINQLVNGGAGYNAIVSPFEAVASRTGEELYDAVVTNVPFGDVHDRGSNRMIDPRYQDQPLETYFILRTLEKLKPGGLAAYIVPPRVVSAKGGREEKLRMAASFMAEFMGAYRLPNSVFGSADADTITDVIVFRKFGRDAAEKVAELREQKPALLTEAKVLWSEFIDGRYFQGEGKPYVLGEFVPKDSSKFRDVDRVVSDLSVANIAQLLRKFPGSRIDWKAIEVAETEPIDYNEGDSMTLAGQTLQMRGGVWVALGKAAEDSTFDALGQVLTSPLAAVSNAVNWDQAAQYVEYLRSRSLDLRLPVWLRMAHGDVARLAEGDRGRLWSAVASGLAVVDVMQEHASEPAFNYLAEYPVLSDAIKANASTKAAAAFSRESKAAFTKASIVYSRKAGFSALWKGEVAAEVDIGELDANAKVNALVYESGATVDVARLKSTLGEEFDLMASEDWCLDATGQKATKADDYYVGNYAEFLRRIDGEIRAADNDAVREKLLRQRAAADARVERLDPTALRYNLFTPFVTLEEKAEFLRRFLDPHFVVGVNNLGEPYILWDGPTKHLTIEQKLMSRIASYVSGDAGGRGVRSLTLQGKYIGMSDRDALAMLRKVARRINTQFDGWVKANPIVMGRLQRTANDPERLYFTEVDDNSPLEIPGMNRDLALHGYQNAFIRKQARGFGGTILGWDVGLGKTFGALATTQYVQSIGVKRKTMIVVPNSVLSNWRREASRAYESLDDCLFIGLNINEKTGKATVGSSDYARDFTRVLENRHRKIFCTMEAFSALPLKDETVAGYEAHMMHVDPSFAPSEKNADSERAASKLAEATSGTSKKSSAYPFFEDMGIDSLVLDEAHAYKNSKNTVEFSGAKFLSVAEASQRGLDMQIKAWFVRGLTAAGDGVLPLTATPLTNSPLEIYSMLTLAAGEKKVHDLCMGAAGADAFMDTMCMIEEGEDVGIDGTVKNYNIFTGLQNVAILRSAIGATATIKTGKDVALGGDDLKLPDAPENATAVQLPQDVKDRLTEYQLAYRAARMETGTAAKDAEPVPQEAYEALERVQARFGEELELIGHPFNLIQKMTALIADPELDERATFYTILAAQKPQAEAAIAAFNKLKKVEERARPSPMTPPDAVGKTKERKDGDDKIVVYQIAVRAGFARDGRVFVDTLDYKTQVEFEKLAEKNGLDLDVAVPPKLAALLANVKNEEANPRSMSGRVKQLVFCDILPMHNKIKRVLTKHAGIPAAAIAIISGQSIKDAEQMQDIQDGFNAEGEDNRLRGIIANEKAEVGINLQKGTQAIHHLTIGWTPDSQHQRNGRGVRQGNTTARVNIYHYDADGTFDEYKRTLTTKKADWIGAVMDKQGGNEVQVSGGLTNEQYDELIESMGDATAIKAIQDRAALREKLRRAESARQRQIISLQTAMSQGEFVTKYNTFSQYLGAKAVEAFDLHTTLQKMRERPTSKMKAETLVRFESRIAEMETKLNSLLRDLDDAAEWSRGTPSEWIVKGIGRYGASDGKWRESIASNATHGSGNAKDESALRQEWQSETAQANAMADEALKEFARIGRQGGGAHDPRVADAIKAGEGFLLDGQPVVKGMFLRDSKGNLSVIAGNKDHQGIIALRFPSVRAYVADILRGGGKLIGFESPEYDAALVEAARLDDEAEDVSSYNENMLFSAISPEVAERRTKVTMVRYSGDVLLPSPYFAYPIDPAEIGAASPLLKGIVDAQAKLIDRWDGDDFFAPAGAGVENADWQQRSEAAKVAALAGYARGLGRKFTLEDLAIALYQSAEAALQAVRVTQPKAPAEAGRRLSSVQSRQELDGAAQAILAQTYDWLEVPAGTAFAVALPASEYGVVNAFYEAERRIKKAEDEVAAAARAAAFATGTRSEQYEAYRKAIEEATASVPAGMLGEIEVDERLDEGEAEALKMLAAQKDKDRALAAGDGAEKLGAAMWTSPTGEVRVYFNDLPSQRGAKAYVVKADDGSLRYMTTTGFSYLGDSARKRVRDVFGTHKPTFDELVQVMSQRADAPSAEDGSPVPGVSTDELSGIVVSAAGRIGLNGQTLLRVTIGGVTKPVKDFIKDASQEVGEAAKWQRDQQQWDITPAAWGVLSRKYPEAANMVTVVPAAA